MTKTTRTGKTLTHTINTCPTAELLTLGFSVEQAARMLKVRRVLPLMEDRREPCIDARKLWERIGKPHGRFNMWADAYVKPLIEDSTLNAEISAFVDSSKPGKPKKDYVLSRDVAAHLAMMARTPEGSEIRRYFLDMEEAALRIAKRNPIRAELIVTTDNEMTHHFRKKAGDLVKSGDIPKSTARTVATEKEKKLKSFVCRLLTGKSAGYWRETFGGHRGIRDVLNAEDLGLYGRCYDTAASLIRGGIVKEADLEKILRPTFGDKIEISRYAESVE